MIPFHFVQGYVTYLPYPTESANVLALANTMPKSAQWCRYTNKPAASQKWVWPVWGSTLRGSTQDCSTLPSPQTSPSNTMVSAVHVNGTPLLLSDQEPPHWTSFTLDLTRLVSDIQIKVNDNSTQSNSFKKILKWLNAMVRMSLVSDLPVPGNQGWKNSQGDPSVWSNLLGLTE